MVVAVGVIMLIIAAFISIKMALSFTRPVQAVNESLSKLADGRFSKVDKFSTRKDEFGQMVRNTNGVIDKLDEIVASIKESASSVGTSSSRYKSDLFATTPLI